MRTRPFITRSPHLHKFVLLFLSCLLDQTCNAKRSIVFLEAVCFASLFSASILLSLFSQAEVLDTAKTSLTCDQPSQVIEQYILLILLQK